MARDDTHLQIVADLLLEAARVEKLADSSGVADRILLFPQMRAALAECMAKHIRVAEARDRLRRAVARLRSAVYDMRQAAHSYERDERLPIGPEYMAFCTAVRDVMAALEELG